MLAARYDLDVHRRLRRIDADRVIGAQGAVVTRRQPRPIPRQARRPTAASPPASPGSRTSSRPTTRRRTSRRWSPRRSRRCRRSPSASRSSPSTTARSDRTPAIADELAARASRSRSASSTTPRNHGYGAALRSGSRPPATSSIAFTDGDRQFRVADIGRLTARLAEADAPDVVVGFRIRRRTRPSGSSTPGVPARQPDLLRPPVTRRRLRLQAVPARGARRASRVESGGAFFSAELLIKLRAAGRTRRRGRRAALPADGRLADRRQAAGRRPGRPRLLAAAAADVGQPRRRALPAERRRPDRLAAVVQPAV